MIAMALAAPFLIRRFGLATVFVVALLALAIRSIIAGSFSNFAVIFPTQVLDGIGAGLPRRRFNVGLAAVMTVQGIGASLSNVVVGWLTNLGGYGLAYWAHGGIAVLAVGTYIGRQAIAPAQKSDSDVGDDLGRDPLTASFIL